MIKARRKYPTDLYGTIYIDNIQKAIVICLIIPTIFPVDAGSIIKNTRMYDVRCPPCIVILTFMLIFILNVAPQYTYKTFEGMFIWPIELIIGYVLV